jgi:outer membrane protein TolC
VPDLRSPASPGRRGFSSVVAAQAVRKPDGPYRESEQAASGNAGLGLGRGRVHGQNTPGIILALPPTVTTLALVPLLLTLAGAPEAPSPSAVTLDQALEELDRQSLTLVQARSRVDEAQGVARQALAALLPTASAGVSYLHNSDEARLALALPPPAPTVDKVLQAKDSTTWTAGVRVPLLVPTAWFDLAAAREAARAAGRSSDAARLALRAALAQSAHLATGAEEQVAAAARAVESAAALVQSAERRVQAGTAAPLEVTRARAEQVRRQSDLVGARAAVEGAWLGVGVLLGRSRPVRIQVPDVEGAPAPGLDGPAEALVGEALQQRPEVDAQTAQARAAEAGIRSAWARLLPQLSASASASHADVPFLTGKKDAWRVGVDLTWPIYDGGYRYGKLRQAEAQATGARAGLDAERLAVEREVLDGQRNLRVADERLRLAHAQAELAADTAASIRRSFEAGIASSLDVIDANDRLYLADSGLADARARLAQARIALRLALGRGP